LLTLNAAHNSIDRLLDFEPPANLLYADFSHNKITKFGPKANEFIYLQRLYLDGNEISEINGIDQLGNLQILSLNKNHIRYIENLTYQTNLELLNLGSNDIEQVSDGFETLVNLKVLDLSNNRIGSMKGL
jgi:hypothetical protein